MKVQGMTIAVTNMDAMVSFYTAVFAMEFSPSDLYGRTLYNGELDGLKFLFCPADLAGNTAEQNRHQLDVVVEDIHALVDRVRASGGELMGEMVEDKTTKQIGIKDPDGNSLTLIEEK